MYRLLVMLLCSVVVAGCGTGVGHEQTPPILTGDAIALVQHGAQSHLLVLHPEGREIVHSGPRGSMWYKADTGRLWMAIGGKVWKYSPQETTPELIYETGFPDMVVTQVMVRADEQIEALLLEAPTRYFEDMVPCGRQRFCALEVRHRQSGAVRIVGLPPAHRYMLLHPWPIEQAHPYVMSQPHSTMAEYYYVDLDDEGTGMFYMAVRQQGAQLPIVEYFSNDLQLETFSFPFVEERRPEGWRVFYFRSAEEIYHRFPSEFRIPKVAQVVPAPDLRSIAYRLSDTLYLFTLQDRSFRPIGKADRLLGWEDGVTVVYELDGEGYRYQRETEVIQPYIIEIVCGEKRYYAHYKGWGMEIGVGTPDAGKPSIWQGERVEHLWCTQH